MSVTRWKRSMTALVFGLSLLAPGFPPAANAGADGLSLAALGEPFILANAVRYCERVPGDCAAGNGEAPPESAEAIAGLLAVVNDHVNATTGFRLDGEQYGASDVWTVPANGFGDCEDYALAKRKLLIEAGVDPRNLRITLVRFFEGGQPVNHALLGVVTDRGLRFLDMNEDMIGDATAFTLRFGYRFEAIQTSTDFTVYEPMRQPALCVAQTR